MKSGSLERQGASILGFLSVSRLIAGFVALVCVALLVLETSHVVGQRDEVMTRARMDTANLAASLAQHADLTFRTADALLIGTVERLENETEFDQRAQQRLRNWFIQEVNQSSQFVGFAVVGSDGLMIMSSAAAKIAINVSDRDYFSYHKEHNDHRLLIGKPVQGRAAGEWIIPVTRRFNRADGTFGGIALAALDPYYFQKLYDGLELGKSGAVVLASLSGNLLVRRPFVEANIGRDMSQSGIFRQLKEARAGSAEITATMDGVRRLNSYEQGKDYPFVISVARNVDELLAPWQENAVRQLGLAAILVGFIALLGLIVWRIASVFSNGARIFREMNLRFDAALSNMAQGISMFDRELRLVVWNARYAEIYRLPAQLLRVGTPRQAIVDFVVNSGITTGRILDSYNADSRPDSSLQPSVPRPGETRIEELADGRIIKLSRQELDEGGWLTTHEDITDRIAREKEIFAQSVELARLNSRFDAALTNMSQGVCLFDTEKNLVISNSRFRELYDLPEALTVPGTPLAALLDYQFKQGVRDDDRTVEQNLEEIPTLIQQSISTADGRTILIRRTPIEGGGWVATHEDVTEQRRAQSEIAYLARHDALTGLANRAQFNAKLDEASKRSRRNGDAVTVVMLDLDKFKAVNDTLGHPAGDRLLVEVARRLGSVVRETDLLARLGGDEFAILQEGGKNQHEGAIALALRIIRVITRPFDLNGHKANVGTSIGIAMAPEHGCDPEDLLKRADLALYDVKANGRNDFRIFQPEMLQAVGMRESAEQELREAIEQEQFELYYQQVLDAKTRSLRSVEALVRWRHPKRGLIGPDQFIPLAEETDLIIPLGEWIIQQACRDAALFPAHVKIAVNVSPIQFNRANLLDVILCTLVETGLGPERLELEITETTLLEHREANLTTVRQLKNLGISIVLDDFGVGYSSINYLTVFPFDKIKIDKSFAQGAVDRREFRAVVAATLALARELGILTTAEGIETAAQFEYMRETGVDFVQGYLFGRPAPAAQLDTNEARSDQMIA
jgi:diguanylate cyclase (GGDEF)-like protein